MCIIISLNRKGEKCLKRQAINLLIKWKQKSNRKPLIIKGVRQCGKTYLMKEFGQSEYEDVAYFNFEVNSALQV